MQSKSPGQFITFEPRPASPAEFVDFWSARYDDGKYDESIYLRHISAPLTPGSICELFRWKNGTPLSAGKKASLSRNFVERLSELSKLSSATSAEEFLSFFSEGGAVWRIFWLHCWQHERFPIYDQHVHRAMAYVLTGTSEEAPAANSRKVRAYLDRYLPFLQRFRTLPPRQVDRALWTFGKYLKDWMPNTQSPK
ncbi:MAG: hypothetical protein H7210_08245 [Pyrinomonadaceae bacterium]|nr:hypothetical protein [Phycisphaerales bacterium]